MTITTDIPLPVAVSYANREGVSTEKVDARASKNVTVQDHYKIYRFEQKVIAWDLGRKRLKLLQQPMVRIDAQDWKLRMPEWGIEVGISDASALPRLMARRFLELRDKAADDLLTDDEAKCWLHIVRNADMHDYAIHEARPRYVEGKLLVRSDILKVLWHDSTEATVHPSFAVAFDLVNIGEEFSAYVKFGAGNKVIHIEDVIPRHTATAAQ